MPWKAGVFGQGVYPGRGRRADQDIPDISGLPCELETPSIGKRDVLAQELVEVCDRPRRGNDHEIAEHQQRGPSEQAPPESVGRSASIELGCGMRLSVVTLISSSLCFLKRSIAKEMDNYIRMTPLWLAAQEGLIGMAIEQTDYRSIDQDELLALAKTSRVFVGIQFSPAVSFDELDFSESCFERCLFGVPILRGVNLSRAQFKNCKFELTRFASCKFGSAHFYGCILFDVEQKKGCTFAFCDLQSVETAKCNFATNTFERCDLYNLHAVECSFRGAQFHQSTFTKTLSRRSAVTRASFDTCNFSFADLSGLSLQNSEFLSCKFSEASFIDADLTNASMLACALDRVEWDRARLAKADLRGSQISGLNLAVVSDYAGLAISESEQTAILQQLGVIVHPK